MQQPFVERHIFDLTDCKTKTTTIRKMVEAYNVSTERKKEIFESYKDIDKDCDLDAPIKICVCFEKEK